MSYESRSRLGFDAAFRDRNMTCCKEQAMIFKDDGRADIAALAVDVIRDPGTAHGIFEFVVVSPSFVDVEDASTITDGDLLAAVQAVWPTYAGVLHPSEPPA